MVLRCNPPFSICTLCAGEKKIGKDYHRGILRNMEDFNKYIGEWLINVTIKYEK